MIFPPFGQDDVSACAGGDLGRRTTSAAVTMRTAVGAILTR
jgi:hypothetical protein